MTKTLKETIIEVIPGERETEMCENLCDGCLKAEGYNSYRQELIDNGLDKILEVVRGKIKEYEKFCDKEYLEASERDLVMLAYDMHSRKVACKHLLNNIK